MSILMLVSLATKTAVELFSSGVLLGVSVYTAVKTNEKGKK